MILKRNDKTKKIDLSSFFNGEEAYLTIKYINREVWRYINRLTLKTAEASFYAEIVNDKEYKDIQKQIDKAKTEKERVELLNKLNDVANNLLVLKYKNVTTDNLNETLNLEIQKNKMLIEAGILSDEGHNFTDEKGNKISLNYDNLKDTIFFDFLINEIIKFNGEFDLLERR
ncbi:MAG: hypothetical protein GYA14_13815 [Ignavibacteria bacterium]|nr:hypothetical protein [Ignavibacteria bacterium]